MLRIGVREARRPDRLSLEGKEDADLGDVAAGQGPEAQHLRLIGREYNPVPTTNVDQRTWYVSPLQTQSQFLCVLQLDGKA